MRCESSNLAALSILIDDVPVGISAFIDWCDAQHSTQTLQRCSFGFSFCFNNDRNNDDKLYFDLFLDKDYIELYNMKPKLQQCKEIQNKATIKTIIQTR